MVDILFRVLQSMRLIRKYWMGTALRLPIVDMKQRAPIKTCQLERIFTEITKFRVFCVVGVVCAFMLCSVIVGEFSYMFCYVMLCYVMLY